MPVNPKPQSSQSLSAGSISSSPKYSNKNGSKIMTVPRVAPSPSPTNEPRAMAQSSMPVNGQHPTPAGEAAPIPGNRKKAKRRMKNAAKIAEQQQQQAQASSHNGGHNGTNGNHGQGDSGPYTFRKSYRDSDVDGQTYSDEELDEYADAYGHSNAPTLPPSSVRSTKKKKGKSFQPSLIRDASAGSNPATRVPPLGMSKEKIWNTSSQEERERIKAFWLELGEEERRSLVKIEKDAVLKKMKDQQKQSCSCTVCGRKRIAIEEELEVLYDAYYEELEQFANGHGTRPAPMLSESKRFGEMSDLTHPAHVPMRTFDTRQPSRGRIIEHLDENDDLDAEEEYSEDELEDEEYSDEEPVEELPRNYAADFFNFGQSLTVQGGILTVADDLLKNDGKKFIEMMEQLAERRMAREEGEREHFHNNSYLPPPTGILPPPHPHTHTHNHPHSHNHTHNHVHNHEEEEYDDEEEDDEEEYDDEDDEEYEDDELDPMDGDQRMEEGRRMFQIFAARMFEQRVLSAYREKVAAERQKKLIEEVLDEAKQAEAKKAKKAEAAAKKKEKAQLKKQALAEEKAKREEEKAEQEVALRAAEDQRAEEAKQKAEEKRKKRDAQKKAEEEEKQKKEAEKQRRQHEQRERQAEQERKAREAKERERKEKEEIRQREKEAKDARERETRERKEKQEKEKREAEAKVKAESKEQRRAKQGTSQAAIPTQIAKRPQQSHTSVPTVPHVQQNIPSPLVAVATPVMPKLPTPSRHSQTLTRDSISVPQTPQVGSSTSQSASPNPTTPLQYSPGPIGPLKYPVSAGFNPHPQTKSPPHHGLKGSSAGFQPGPFQGVGMNGFPPGIPMMNASFGGRMLQQDPAMPHPMPMGNQFRPPPNGTPFSALNSIPIPQARGFPAPHPPPGFLHQPTHPISAPPDSHKDMVQGQSHSRQHSESYEKAAFESQSSISQTQPIARPAPIGRPASNFQGYRSQDDSNDIDDLSKHLGSSALLDDADEPIAASTVSRHSSIAPSSVGRQGFPQPVPFGAEPQGFPSTMSYGSWGAPATFGSPSMAGPNYLSSWPNSNNAFNPLSGPGPARPGQPRSITVRQMLCKACLNLKSTSPDGYSSLAAIRDQIERQSLAMNFLREEAVSEKELLDLCDTEGNPNNGGGFFDVRSEGRGTVSIRFDPGAQVSRHVGAPGEIGSPIAPGAGLHHGSGRFTGVSAHGSSF